MSTTATTPLAPVRVPLTFIIIAGCLIAMMSFGVRSTAGLFTVPVTAEFGWSRETWGLAFAVQNLIWGLIQPIAGGFADKHGTAKTLVIGTIVYALGVLLLAYGGTEWTLFLGAGLLMGLGIGTASFAVVMAAFGRAVPAEKRSFVFGIATAASSAGQFVFAPVGQQLINGFGWQNALLIFAITLLAIIPLSFFLRGKSEHQADDGRDMPVFETLREAFKHRSYVLLVIGFFVCGFHLAFVTVHMPAYLVQCGLSPTVGSWALALIGLFNIVGSLGAGYLAGRLPKQFLLASIYLSRVVITGLFLLLPISEWTTYIFAAITGLLWLATVPPTAALVTDFFGPKYMGMLYGFAFLSHQIGSFFGVWLGGVSFDLTGNYDLVWYLGMMIGLLSAALHLPIKQNRAPHFAVVAPGE
ncbi:MFS transporter [Maritalea mediterranea]|uniref:MFS transporter n=1 Tax=Maritalea mediterranea TaxID=2909667 RepID=A0ABS9E7B5_9HYPH|nr:MFS transporter [Maritalea mediterranea]MCF4098771.1 MFS transporter [Maritalea mediterranea]